MILLNVMDLISQCLLNSTLLCSLTCTVTQSPALHRIHSFTLSLVCQLHSFTVTNSLCHWFVTHSFPLLPLTRPLTQSLVFPLSYSLICSLIHSFVYLLTHSLVEYSLTHSLAIGRHHSLTHSLTHSHSRPGPRRRRSDAGTLDIPSGLVGG